MRAVLRRVAPAQPAAAAREQLLTYGDLAIDGVGLQVRKDGRELVLAPSELKLLLFLSASPAADLQPPAAPRTGLGAQLLRRCPPGRRVCDAAAVQDRGRPAQPALRPDRARLRLPLRPAVKRRLGSPAGLRTRLVVGFLLVSAVSALTTAVLTYQQARTAILDRAQDSAVHGLRDQVGSLAPGLPARPTDTDLRTLALQLDRAGGARNWHTAAAVRGGPLRRRHHALPPPSPPRCAAPRPRPTAPSCSASTAAGTPSSPSRCPSPPPTAPRSPPGSSSTPPSRSHREQRDVTSLVAAARAGVVPVVLVSLVPALLAARRCAAPGTAAALRHGEDGRRRARHPDRGHRRRRTRRTGTHLQHHGRDPAGRCHHPAAHGGGRPAVRRRRLARDAHPARGDDRRDRRARRGRRLRPAGPGDLRGADAGQPTRPAISPAWSRT